MTAMEILIQSITTAGKNGTLEVLKKYQKENSKGIPESSTAVPVILEKTHVTLMSDGITKTISVSDFMSMLESLTETDNKAFSPIGLPFGCFLLSKNADKIYLNCYYKETTAQIQFMASKDSLKVTKFTIPLPNIVIAYTLKSVGKDLWQVENTLYFATPLSVTQLPDNKFINALDPSKGIYRLPVSNMYGDCRMCYGGNTMPARFSNNLRGLDYYYQILTQAPFNNDLGVVGTTTSYTPNKWFEFLDKKTSFPYELLKG